MTKMRLSALQDTIETVGRDRLPKLRALGEINLRSPASVPPPIGSR